MVLRKMVMVPVEDADRRQHVDRNLPLIKTSVDEKAAKALRDDMDSLLQSNMNPDHKLKFMQPMMDKYLTYYGHIPSADRRIIPPPAPLAPDGPVLTPEGPVLRRAATFIPEPKPKAVAENELHVEERGTNQPSVMPTTPVRSNMLPLNIDSPPTKKHRTHSLSKYDLLRGFPHNEKSVAKRMLDTISANSSILDWDRATGELKFKSANVPGSNFAALLKSYVKSPNTFVSSKLDGAPLLYNGLKALPRSSPVVTRGGLKRKALGDNQSIMWGTVHK